MSEDFRQPTVFGAGYKGEARVSNGRVVEVASLDEIPYQLREKIPALAEACADGYIVKRYRSRKEQVPEGPSFLALEDLSDEGDISYFEEASAQTGKPFPLSTHERAKLTIVDQLVLLKERQDQLRAYFSDTLPDTVLQSEFLIAPDEKQEFYLYEIQEKIPEHVDLETISEEQIGRLSQEVKSHLRVRLEALREKLKALAKEKQHPYYKFFIPDLNATNIAITTQGEVKIYDTNLCDLRGTVMSALAFLHTIERVNEVLQKL